MRSFLDKICVVFTLLIFLSCNKNIKNIENNIEFFNSVKDILIDKEAFKDKKTLYITNLKFYLDYTYLDELRDFKLLKIIKSQDVYIFYFQDIYAKTDSFISNEPSIKILLYCKDLNKRRSRAYFEQFAECRKSIKDIHKNWTLVVRDVTCQD